MAFRIREGVTLGPLSVGLMVSTIILILAWTKIYVSHQIYFESRQAHRLEQEVAALKEEKRSLQMRIETLRYKSQITDTIFSMDTGAPPADQPLQATHTQKDHR